MKRTCVYLSFKVALLENNCIMNSLSIKCVEFAQDVCVVPVYDVSSIVL